MSPARGEDSGRSFSRRLAAVIAVAAALRVVYLAQTLADPLLRDLLILDSRIYDESAVLIIGGNWAAGDEVFALGPLYAYFLAAVRALFGEGTAALYAAQQLLGLGSIVLVALIARRCFTERAALAAAGLIALYGAMAMLELKVMASTLAVFLSLASLQLILVARERGWRWGAFAPGLVLGLACLARPNTLLFVPLAVLWTLWDGGRRLEAARLPAALALAAGAIVAIAPATARNYAVAGEFVLISSQSGITFYQANNDRARGLYTRLPGFVGTPTEMRRQARRRAEKDAGRALAESEVSRYWTRRGLSYLTGNPSQAVALVGKKLRYWTTSDEYSTEYVLDVERDFVPALWAMPIPFGVIFALAFLGARQTGVGRPEPVLLYGFVAANLASVLIFYFSSRYRMPAVPVLAAFAGGGCAAVVDRFRDSARGFWIWTLPALIVAAYSLHSWSDHLQATAAQQHYNYAQVYSQRGLYAVAADRYRSAIELLDARWQPHLGLAHAYEQLGDPEAALHAYERVLELRPGQPVAAERAARLRQHAGR